MVNLSSPSYEHICFFFFFSYQAPLPLRNWKEGNLPDGVLRSIEELGYKEPSPIQRQGIPVGLEFRDMIGIAETGSGKTAAFGIPMISYILSLPDERRKCIAAEGPLACIMAPTRELAIQIHEECLKFAKYTGLKMACIVGGQDIEVQGFLLGQVRDDVPQASSYSIHFSFSCSITPRTI